MLDFYFSFCGRIRNLLNLNSLFDDLRKPFLYSRSTVDSSQERCPFGKVRRNMKRSDFFSRNHNRRPPGDLIFGLRDNQIVDFQ